MNPLSVSALLLASTLLVAGGAPARAAEGGAIASKLEEQGQMRYLKVTDLRAVKRDGLLRVQAEISNSDNATQQLYYRVKWLDADGFAVWEEEPWKPVLLYGLQKKTLSLEAPTFKASDFRLQLQSPSNAGRPNDAPARPGGLLNQ